MALCTIFIVFLLSEIVLMKPTENNKTIVYNDISKCPNATSVIKTCFNKTIVELNNVTDENEDTVLCTIYLKQLSMFQKKLNMSNMTEQICNQSLVFPTLVNVQVCENLNFLGNSTIPTEKLKSICTKLCYGWKGELDSRCLFAYYYNNFTLNNTKFDKVKPLVKTQPEMPAVIPNENKVEKKTQSVNITNNILSTINQDAGNKSNSKPLTSKSDIEKQNPTVTKIKVTTEKVSYVESEDIGNGQVEIEENDDSMYNENRGQDLPGNEVSKMEKPNIVSEDVAVNSMNTELGGESYFFSYFMVICIMFVMGYVLYHNRAKVMALVLEGKRNKRQSRSRRPNSANYHKLDSNLEEALSSTCNKNSNQIIY